jgi:SdpC family antimicrobial peptide
MKLSIPSKLTVAAMALLSITSLGAGCGGTQEEAAASPPDVQARQQSLSGRELYKGMFFGVGPAARHFDDIWQHPKFQAGLSRPEVRQQRERTAERLVAKLEAADPAFFDRFSRDLRSRDHLTIDRLVATAQEKTVAAVAALRQEDGLGEQVRGSAIAAEQPGVIVVVDVLVEQTVEVTTQYWLFPGPPPMADVNGLFRDEWVDSLVNKSFGVQ